MESENSITDWIANLREGPAIRAQQQLWDRYFQRLAGFARVKLGDAPRGGADEEDVALSALNSFFTGVHAGEFPTLHDRTSLWPLLAKIAARKAINQRKSALRKKRGGGRVLNEGTFATTDETSALGLDHMLVDDLTPQHLAELREECRRLLAVLPDAQLAQIAIRKLEGFQNSEIASQFGVAERTIERKLQRIRNLWGHTESV
ncbi:MAG: hypothetical protein KDA61_09695 [Planctomycetales bacterium]|nr:hypothetical protein [Planctomycetales bacterium]